jgi:hypothetical protein
MSLTATCGASDRAGLEEVGVIVIWEMVPRMDGDSADTQEARFHYRWVEVTVTVPTSAGTTEAIASENLLRLRLRQAPCAPLRIRNGPHRSPTRSSIVGVMGPLEPAGS